MIKRNNFNRRIEERRKQVILFKFDRRISPERRSGGERRNNFS